MLLFNIERIVPIFDLLGYPFLKQSRMIVRRTIICEPNNTANIPLAKTIIE